MMCKRNWTDIKSRYAKLKMLINTGRITEEMALNHPETSKYLDGTLSFLDPYLIDVTEADITSNVNKKFNKIFGIVDRSCDRNDSVVLRRQEQDDSHHTDSISIDNTQKYLINVGNTVKHGLGHLIPNENIPSTSNIKKTWNRIQLGLESELLIEDNIKMEDDTEHGILEEDPINNNMNVTEDDSVEHILPDIDNHMTMVDSMEENISMTDSDVLIGVRDNEMKNFFNELGEVMSTEMPMEKQKISRMRINALIIELLDEERL